VVKATFILVACHHLKLEGGAQPGDGFNKAQREWHWSGHGSIHTCEIASAMPVAIVRQNLVHGLIFKLNLTFSG